MPLRYAHTHTPVPMRQSALDRNADDAGCARCASTCQQPAGPLHSCRDEDDDEPLQPPSCLAQLPHHHWGSWDMDMRTTTLVNLARSKKDVGAPPLRVDLTKTTIACTGTSCHGGHVQLSENTLPHVGSLQHPRAPLLMGIGTCQGTHIYVRTCTTRSTLATQHIRLGRLNKIWHTAHAATHSKAACATRDLPLSPKWRASSVRCRASVHYTQSCSGHAKGPSSCSRWQCWHRSGPDLRLPSDQSSPPSPAAAGCKLQQILLLHRLLHLHAAKLRGRRWHSRKGEGEGGGGQGMRGTSGRASGSAGS